MANIITYHVSTPEDIADALYNAKTIGYSNTYEIILDNDIDFNTSSYYCMMSNFFDSSSLEITINGNGHTMSNIYIYPTYAFWVCSSGYPVTFKNLKIEAILNNSNLFKNATLTLEDCIINVKLYNLYNYGITDVIKNAFTNTIFNIYVVNSDYSSPYLFKNNNGNSANIESCIFRIRDNRPNYNLNFFTDSMSGTVTAKHIFDNCAIFYDIINSERISNSEFSFGGDGPKFLNSYIATLNDNPVHVKIGNFSFEAVGSFFNRDYFTLAYSKSGMTGLTTEQCKDKTALANIGYVFAEET